MCRKCNLEEELHFIRLHPLRARHFNIVYFSLYYLHNINAFCKQPMLELYYYVMGINVLFVIVTLACIR